MSTTPSINRTGALKHDATVCRMLVIDESKYPEWTAEEFLSYIADGFIPFFTYVNASSYAHVYEIGAWIEEANGITITSQNCSLFCPYADVTDDESSIDDTNHM